MVAYHPWMGRLLFEHPSLRGEMADTDLLIVNLDMEATSLSVASRGAQPHIIRNCTNMPIRVLHFDRDRSQSYQRQSKRSFSLNPGQSRDGPIMLWHDDRTQFWTTRAVLDLERATENGTTYVDIKGVSTNPSTTPAAAAPTEVDYKLPAHSQLATVPHSSAAIVERLTVA